MSLSCMELQMFREKYEYKIDFTYKSSIPHNTYHEMLSMVVNIKILAGSLEIR